MSRRTASLFPLLLGFCLASSPVLAQALGLQADPSPFAPGDLKKPIFDTSKPVYNLGDVRAKSASTVVAEVDGRAVTLGEVADAIAELPPNVRALPFPDLFPAVLGQLIRQQALVIKAHQQGLDEDPTVRRRMTAASDRILIDAYLREAIGRSVTEQSLLDTYAKAIASKPGPEEVHVRVIMVPTSQAAEGIIAELRAGADFAALARRSSKDATAPSGGDLGFVQRDGLNAEIGAVAFALQPNQVTAYPVRSAGAWFVVKVEERRMRPTPSFAEVRERLAQDALQSGVPDVVSQSLASVTVREYDINGKE
jgi:peptidyl-prolyl cis-trans isomerase C